MVPVGGIPAAHYEAGRVNEAAHNRDLLPSLRFRLVCGHQHREGTCNDREAEQHEPAVHEAPRQEPGAASAVAPRRCGLVNVLFYVRDAVAVQAVMERDVMPVMVDVGSIMAVAAVQHVEVAVAGE